MRHNVYHITNGRLIERWFNEVQLSTYTLFYTVNYICYTKRFTEFKAKFIMNR